MKFPVLNLPHSETGGFGSCFLGEFCKKHDIKSPPNLKMGRLKQWCEDVNKAQSDVEFGFVFVDEASFHDYRPKTFKSLVSGFKDYQNLGD